MYPGRWWTVGKDMNYRGGNVVTGSLMDGLHVLLGTFAGWFCEWGIGALCGKWGLSFVCSTLVENPSSRRGDELTWRVGRGRVNMIGSVRKESRSIRRYALSSLRTPIELMRRCFRHWGGADTA